MRAIAALLVFLGSGCALAQDAAPSKDPVRPGIQLVPWSFKPVPQPEGIRRSRGRQREAVELAGGPPSVCSVKLLEMAIPKDIDHAGSAPAEDG